MCQRWWWSLALPECDLLSCLQVLCNSHANLLTGSSLVTARLYNFKDSLASIDCLKSSVIGILTLMCNQRLSTMTSWSGCAVWECEPSPAIVVKSSEASSFCAKQILSDWSWKSEFRGKTGSLITCALSLWVVSYTTLTAQCRCKLLLVTCSTFLKKQSPSREAGYAQWNSCAMWKHLSSGHLNELFVPQVPFNSETSIPRWRL